MEATLTNLQEQIHGLQIALEEKKLEHKQARRPFTLYCTTLGIILALVILGSGASGFLGQTPFAFLVGWAVTFSIIFGIVLVVLVFYFFIYSSSDGFGGIERLEHIHNLQNEIEKLQTLLHVREMQKLQQRTALERSRDDLIPIITKFKNDANRYRRSHYTVQMLIALLSLVVSGLTSGLTGLIGIPWPWIAPILSLLVTFFTGFTALFRFRDRSLNLQKTADSIEHELACCEKRIFDYENDDDKAALRRLAKKTEELQNEQRKLQQQLEQASEVKQPSES